MQNIIVAILFIAALGYLLRIGIRAFRSSGPACVKGCGACSTIDFEAIEKKLKERESAH
jgi:hypothetical protein